MFCLYILSPHNIFPEWTFDITSRIDSDNNFQNRVIADYSEIRLFGYWEGETLEIQDFQGGFKFPIALGGPVSFRGNFRELFKPGGYVPGSPVFFESPGIKGNYDLALKSTIGGAIYLPGNEFGLGGVYYTREHRLHFAAWLNLLPGEMFALNTVLLGSMMRINGNEDDSPDNCPWMEEYMISNPKLCLHSGLKVDFLTDYFNTSVLGGCSSSRISLPGFFIRGAGGFSFKYLEADLSCCYSGPTYLTPDGSYPSKIFTLGASAVLFPEFFIRAKGRYTKGVLRLPLYPVMFIPAEDTFSVTLEMATSAITVSANWDYEQVTDEFDELEGEESFGGEIALFPARWISFNSGFTYIRTSVGDDKKKVPLILSFQGTDFELSAKSILLWEEDLTLENRIRLDVKGANGSAFIKIEADIPIKSEWESFLSFISEVVYIQFGWSISGGT